MIKINNLTVEFGDKKILNDISFSVHEGDWLMVVGPNGAGKSTIVNAVSKAVPYTGDIYLKEKNIRDLKSIEQAKIMGVLNQSHNVAYSFTVEDIVKLGRYANKGKFLDSYFDTNSSKVERAIEITGLNEIRYQSVLTLSGGELQRTFLAQLFAQDPEILVLDEPTNHLDLVYQKQIFSLVEDWIKENKCCVVSIVHDLSLAKKYGNKAMLLNHGEIVRTGDVSDVFSKEDLKKVYNMDVYGWMNDLAEVWKD
ncbi:MAG: ABC transporter ATP-binding protein [Peptostreptococcaceae bacterium]|nr:ABC transporter ATP-binding protein [Peptostreptococcaceae bacterium]